MSTSAKIDRVWVFDEKSLDSALRKYRDEALSAYPHQRERIELTVLAMRDFLYSEHAAGLTLND